MRPVVRDVEAELAAPSVGRETLLGYLDDATRGNGTVHFVRSGEEVRWPEMWRDAHECAAWIHRNLPQDRTLAGVLEATRPCLVALLGSWLAGRGFASLPHRSRGMDRDEYRRQISTLVELAGAGIVATPSELHGTLQGMATLSYDDFGRRRPATGGDGGFIVQFTSGSTDRPRGVVLDMAQIAANAQAMAESVAVRQGDVFYSWLPLSHDMGLMGMCLAPLATFAPRLGGASHVWLSDPRQFVRDPVSWLRLGSDVGGTVTTAPNTALDLVARRLESRPAELDLSSLRCLIVGAETVSAATLRRFTEVTKQQGFRGDALCPAYGLAEATLAVTMVRPGSGWRAVPHPTPAPGDAPGSAECVALGRPVPDMQVRTHAHGHGHGEVEISGPSVARTFLGRPAQSSPDGWLRTGDLGFLSDGELCFLGRAGDRVVVAGRNVDAASLGRRLSELPGVRDGCCAVIPESPDGYAVALEARASVDKPDLRELCRSVSDAAVRYAGARPARVLVVGRSQVPKTPSGKLQPHRLRALLATGAVVPLVELAARHDTGVAGRPATPTSGDDHGD